MAHTDTAPTVLRITKHAGIAGQLAYVAEVQYPDEPAALVTFTGSTYGGPVVVSTPTLGEVFVDDPARFGRLSPEWVRRFFSES